MERMRDPAAHGGHRARMRQRVRTKGFEGLEPHEIIEFLLFYAIPRQDVNELAHRLIDRFGSVQGVLEAELPELEAVPGVGARTARWLALVGEGAAACAGLSAEGRPQMANYRDSFDCADQMERELVPPCCVQLCLDAGRRILYRRQLCDSLSWGEPATLREGMSDMFSAQANNALLFIFTGDRIPEAQSYDILHAAGYAASLRAAGCDLLDVVLSSGGTHSSMRKMNLIPVNEETPHARAVREEYLRD